MTGHAGTNLLRKACRLHDPGTLAASTLYSSGEPCAMCAGTRPTEVVGPIREEEAERYFEGSAG